MEDRFHRMVFRDIATLTEMGQGVWPSMDTIRQRLFVAEYLRDTDMIDQAHKNLRKHHLGAVGKLHELLLRSLKEISQRYLLAQNGRVSVMPERIHQWQRILTWMAPLALVAARIWQDRPMSVGESPLDYVRTVLEPMFRASALPTIDEALVDEIIARDGLCDAHIHLNGTTEVDLVWLGILQDPDDLLKSLKKSANREMVQEQFGQIEPGLNAYVVVERLRMAGRARLAAIHILARRPLPMRCQEILRIGSRRAEIWASQHLVEPHPSCAAFGIPPDLELPCEALWLIMAFQHMERTGDETMARLVHAYLLVLNATILPLTVQQESQTGFDQFQKITLNDTRFTVEKDYERRFHQIAYRQHSDLRVVEGRFSPKSTWEENVELLTRIANGYQWYRGRKGERITQSTDPRWLQPIDGSATRSKHMELRLVAHFIKEPDASDGLWRFHSLRHSHSEKLRALVAARKESEWIGKCVTGLDAASNEFDTPPEAFAPLFRHARRAGFRNFTFHVGEDFEHLVSGIRAVDEALEFLDLAPGNRLGHATAVGIEPTLWLARAPERIPRRIGDWLDDLVYAQMVLNGHSTYLDFGAPLADDIERLSRALYGRTVAGSELRQAWRLRRLDPERVIVNSSVKALTQYTTSEERRDECQPIINVWNTSPIELFRAYHSEKFRRRAAEVELFPSNYFSAEALIQLQRNVLKKIVQKNIIIESPPTSNVRIACYRSHEEHHLFRWLGITGHYDEPKPAVCLGTDDPGIFSTNLRNEFIHVWQMLRKLNKSDVEAQGILTALNRRSAAAVFE